MFGFTMTRPETGIAEGVGAEIAVAHGQRGNQSGKGNFLALIFLLAIEKKESLVFPDGAANRAAKLVQIELLLLWLAK